MPLKNSKTREVNKITPCLYSPLPLCFDTGGRYGRCASIQSIYWVVVWLVHRKSQLQGRLVNQAGLENCRKETQCLGENGIYDSFILIIDQISGNAAVKLNLNQAVTFPLQRNRQFTNCRTTTLWTCRLCSKFHPLRYTALLKILPIMF